MFIENRKKNFLQGKTLSFVATIVICEVVLSVVFGSPEKDEVLDAGMVLFVGIPGKVTI